MMDEVRIPGSGRNVLEAPGMFDTMLFLRSVGECKKTDLYRGIGRRTGMAPKLDRLEDAGLIIQERYQGMTVLLLTEDGRRVADMIESIREIIEEETGTDRCPRWIATTPSPGLRPGQTLSTDAPGGGVRE